MADQHSIQLSNIVQRDDLMACRAKCRNSFCLNLERQAAWGHPRSWALRWIMHYLRHHFNTYIRILIHVPYGLCAWDEVL